MIVREPAQLSDVEMKFKSMNIDTTPRKIKELQVQIIICENSKTFRFIYLSLYFLNSSNRRDINLQSRMQDCSQPSQ